MRNLIIVFLLMSCNVPTVSQEENLPELFRVLIKSGSDNNNLDILQQKYANVVEGFMANSNYVYLPDSNRLDSIKLTDALKAKVRAIKYETLYKNNIGTLINGSASQRSLAYTLISCFRDSAYYDTMWHRFELWDEDEGGMLFSCLCNIFPKETDRIFNTLEKHETWGDAVITQLFVRYMDKQSLIATFYGHLHDSIKMAGMFSLQAIATLDSTSKADTAILDILRRSDTHDKGFAIEALKSRKNIHLKSLLSPFLENKDLHTITGEALYMSPFKEDVDYIMEHSTPAERKEFKSEKEMSEIKKEAFNR